MWNWNASVFVKWRNQTVTVEKRSPFAGFRFTLCKLIGADGWMDPLTLAGPCDCRMFPLNVSYCSVADAVNRV